MSDTGFVCLFTLLTVACFMWITNAHIEHHVGEISRRLSELEKWWRDTHEPEP